MIKYLERDCEIAKEADSFEQATADLMLAGLQRELALDRKCYEKVASKASDLLDNEYVKSLKADIDRLQEAVKTIKTKTR